jgi:hypothetical protein
LLRDEPNPHLLRMVSRDAGAAAAAIRIGTR